MAIGFLSNWGYKLEQLLSYQIPHKVVTSNIQPQKSLGKCELKRVVYLQRLKNKHPYELRFNEIIIFYRLLVGK